jgi:hypothetical protein
MKTNNSVKNLTVMAVALAMALVFIGTTFADPGEGRGRRGGGYGYNADSDCSGGYGRGYGRRNLEANLSEEDIEKLNKAREKFFEDTRDLRQNIRQKQLALRAEFAKKSPDEKVALELQKEISTLKAQMADKRLMHRLEMKKINPYLGLGSQGKGKGGKGGKRGGYYAKGQRWQ